MKPETLPWIDKAEGDWDTMRRESGVSVRPNFDAVCFHAQQCAEKYLKERLVEVGIPFARTHDLLNLLKVVAEVEPEWQEFETELSVLSVYGVAGRYPGLVADDEQAALAVEYCKTVRAVVRRSFALDLE